MGRHSQPDENTDLHPVVDRRESTGRHRSVDDPHAAESETTGTHRAIGGHRGVAKWPLAVVAVVGLLAAGIVAVILGVNSTDAAANADAGKCDEGSAALRVAVAPEIAGQVAKAADQWNRQHRVVYSHCITVTATPSTAKQAQAAIRTGTNAPGAWLAPAAKDAADLQKREPGRVASKSAALTVGGKQYPYVGIAATGVDDVQQRAAQAFRTYLDEPDSKRILAG